MPQQLDFDPALDYYKSLGVSSSSTADEIKKAYRKLAKQCHPDSTGGDKVKETRFKEISNAYDVLGDAKKRKLYDEIRAQGGRSPMGGMPGYTYTTSQGAGPGVFDLGDLFGQFFSGAQQQRGRVRVDRMDLDEDLPRSRRRVSDEDEDVSKVKASDGSLLDVRGGDVYSDVRIPFDQAILGTVVGVPTIDGKVDVKVPPGSASGRKLRLRGKGIPDRSGHVGNHYVTVQIDVPTDLDDDAKKLLVQLVQRTRKRGQDH